MKQTGEVVFELKPKKNNPRNSEGAFITLKNGAIRFYYSHYIGDQHCDEGYSCIAFIESANSGKTWGDSTVIFRPEEHGAVNIMSVSLIQMLNGDIGIFYLIRYSISEIRLHLRRSSDEGESWSNAVCCVTHPGYHCTHNDRVVRLKSERLIVPTSLASLRGKSQFEAEIFDIRQSVCFFYSDDDGITWKESSNFCTLVSKHTKNGIQEPGVIELGNGFLYSFARSDMGCQYEMLSLNNGVSWTAPERSIFTSPCAPMSMKRIPKTGQLFTIFNPTPDYQTKTISQSSWGRSPLVYMISDDNGATWNNPVIIEDDENAGFCYTAIHFSDDAILLAYCAGNSEDGICLSKTRIRKINYTELINREG